ncbi:Zinc-binding dehydrogenase [Ceratobasidium sp. AG-Ba]|nr:Zinc-binding dehydrogenase [Ceratobasidium sp. AG-Ba]
MAHATALTRDGGLAEYTVAHYTALVPYPDNLPSIQAPLLCAGLTCFNALRHAHAKPGGIHIKQHQRSRTRDCRVVDTPFGGPGTGPGGVNVVLQTAPEEETLKRVADALAMDAEVFLLGEPESMRIDLPLMPFLIKRASIRGWTAGVPMDAHDTLRFCVQTGVRCVVQTTTPMGAEDAYTDMGAARFRTVVVVDPEEIQKERDQGLA